MKSSSFVAVIPDGEEAVTAEKLAVAGTVIDEAFLTYCFLRYENFSACVTPSSVIPPVDLEIQ